MKEKKTNCYAKEKMLSRVFKRLTLIMLLFSITCLSAWSQTPGVNFLITPASINDIEVGEEFTIKVQADFVNGGVLNAVAVYLNFDPAYLEEVSHVESSLLNIPAVEYSADNTTGKIGYEKGSFSTINTDVDILTITFKAKAVPPGGSTLLSFNLESDPVTDARNTGVKVLLSTTGATVNFTTQNGVACFTDNITADFSQGTFTNTYISETIDGEVILEPSAGAEFNALPPTTEWASYPWTGGTSTVSNGTLIVDGARYNSEPETTTFGPGRSLEFVATFGAQAFQHIGFGGGSNANGTGGIYNGDDPWAMFSTGSDGSQLYVRTQLGGTNEDIGLSNTYIGSSHFYRIDWLDNGTFQYYIDNVLFHTTTTAIITPMRPAISDYNVGGASITVDWIRMSPYSSTGSFESRVYNATQSRGWGAANWNADVPTGTTLSISVRTGNTETPDATWTAWKPLSASGDQVMQNGQYIQYKADMTTTDPNVTPALLNISFDCTENLPLPVKLTSFKATVAGHDVNLNWSTSTEINNKGFNVQRSVDGRTWQTIGFVNGAGNSTATNHYAYSDKNLEDGRYYFRLMQVDFDEQFEYSPVETAVILNANSYLLKQNVPNPLNESTTIQFIIPVKSKTTLSVFDTHGRLIKMLVNETLPAGTHQAIMKKESLSAGIYYYKLQTETFSAIKKMIIQ